MSARRATTPDRCCFEAGTGAVNRVSTEQVLNKAYRLAYFLHQDKDTAIRIIAAATLKLNVAMAVQSKRLYYIPVGRFSRGESRRTDGIRNKALFSDLHLLQRLVYVESEPYERQKERAAQVTPAGVHAVGDPASEEDLLVHFIKHLVRITTKRNAFYVTLGVSRLLHSYRTLETMELYNAVIGEPERVKDDYYYRSRKAVLMHEMYQRFGQLIRACRQRRGEERFETQQGSSELRALMRECLRMFTPWDTQCPVPRDFDPLKSVITSLTSKSSADENKVEVNRIHAVLHPDCFERLVAAFGYSPPEMRMELPRFFSEQTNDQSPPGPRSPTEELSAEELAEINHMLAEQAGRRRRSSPDAVLRILVDGVERGRLNPAEQSSISFSVEEDADIIEVKAMDQHGELLLATHLLTSFTEDAYVSSIRLEGGQQLSLSITRKEPGDDFLVTLGYEETNMRRAARLWWQRHGLSLSAEQGLNPARYILVGSLVVICLVSVLWYVRLQSVQTIGPAQTNIAQATTPPLVPQPSVPEKAAVKPAELKPPRRPRTERSTTAKVTSSPDTSQPRDEDVDVTRSAAVVPNLKLSEVRKVYVELRGDPELRTKVVESLGSSGVVAITNADEADAALKIVVSQTRATAQLVNARGTILWRSATSKTVSESVKDLLSEISRARH
jgi:hypothetical protein